LKEKEVLLKEVHHRVKNNLQIISSLLNLQSKYIKDNQALEMFKESRNRIRSMTLIHEKLYRSKDLANIDVAEYIQNLSSNLFRSYSAGRVRLRTHVDDILLGVDTAIPCGLIINELVSNSRSMPSRKTESW
jgi:two-component sensor histidine kinase